MAAILEKVDRDKIPTGAKILTRTEAVEEYWKLLMNTKDKSDLQPMMYGIPALGIATFFTNYSLFNHYRARLKLGRQGYVMMSIACTVVPALIAPYFHVKLVTNDIILGESCPVCAQTRGMFCQCLVSFGQGLTFTPLLCMLKAQMFCTYDVPGFQSKAAIWKSLQLYRKFTARGISRIYLLLIMNTVLSTVVTASEYKCVEKFNEKLFHKEREVQQIQQNLS